MKSKTNTCITWVLSTIWSSLVRPSRLLMYVQSSRENEDIGHDEAAVALAVVQFQESGYNLVEKKGSRSREQQKGSSRQEHVASGHRKTGSLPNTNCLYSTFHKKSLRSSQNWRASSSTVSPHSTRLPFFLSTFLGTFLRNTQNSQDLEFLF